MEWTGCTFLLLIVFILKWLSVLCPIWGPIISPINCLKQAHQQQSKKSNINYYYAWIEAVFWQVTLISSSFIATLVPVVQIGNKLTERMLLHSRTGTETTGRKSQTQREREMLGKERETLNFMLHTQVELWIRAQISNVCLCINTHKNHTHPPSSMWQMHPKTKTVQKSQ